MPRLGRERSLPVRVLRRIRRLLRRATSSLRVLPDFLIIGTQKSGTTSLHVYLQSHPQIVGPIGRKELHFFDRNWGAGEGHYRSFFPTAPGRRLRAAFTGSPVLCFETTPEYICFTEAQERILALLGPVPLIVLLRDPIDRAWSAYRMHLSDDLNVGFDEILDASEAVAAHEDRELDPAVAPLTQRLKDLGLINRGLYAEQLRALYERWPRERVQVIDFGDLCSDPAGTCARVLERLGLPPLEHDSWPIYNASKAAPLPDDLRARLESFYATPNTELEELLGWTPSWMLGD